MPSTMLPFLYRTRTIQSIGRRCPTFNIARHAHSMNPDSPKPVRPIRRSRRETDKGEMNVPFDWAGRTDPRNSDMQHGTLKNQQLTLSPNEAHIFKRIFEEIAEGKMPPSRNRQLEAVQTDGKKSRQASVVEHARMSEFREKYLQRFPESLQTAANKAMGLFEIGPSDGDFEQMSEEDKQIWAERREHRQLREDEKKRVEGLMRECATDSQLWEAMENEVFSLPKRLGLVTSETTKPAKRSGRSKKPVQPVEFSSPSLDQGSKVVMDVHGPLYSHFILLGLKLFDTGFSRPSLSAFRILPHVKALGLESYVLGVSTPFYAYLAKMHWERYGDAIAALDTIQEMAYNGLYADEETCTLLVRIRDHLTSSVLGLHGPFGAAVAEPRLQDSAFIARLDEVERHANDSMEKHQLQIGG